MFRPPKELQRDPLTVETAPTYTAGLMNFQDRVGPPVSAAWLNWIDRTVFDLQRRITALEAASGQQAQVGVAHDSARRVDVPAGRGSHGETDRK